MGFRGTIEESFEILLIRSHRTQHIKTRNVEASQLKVKIGAQHFSVLDPLLFMTFINDWSVEEKTTKSNLLLYADETSNKCLQLSRNTSISHE